MEKYFINLTNHPSAKWDINQIKEAEKYGKIIDIPFPTVDSSGDEKYIRELCNVTFDKIMEYKPEAVLCQGEFTLVYQLVRRLKECNITVLAACSQRNVIEHGNKKEVIFEFTQFRKYEN